MKQRDYGLDNKEVVVPKKLKRFSTKRIITAVILLLVIFFVIRSVTLRIVRHRVPTAVPKLLVYEDRRPVKAGIIMYETVGVVEGSGLLTKNAPEGARIPAGTEIANINLMTDKTDAKEQLLKVQSAIDYKMQAAEEQVAETGEHEATNTERQLIERIQLALSEGRFYDVSLSMTNLDLMTRRSLDISELGNLMDQSLEELERLKAELEMDVGASNKRYFAPQGGIVTYELDGYEDVLPARDFENYDYQYLINVIPTEIKPVGQEVAEGEKIFKLIDNFKWYLALAIDDVELWKTFEPQQRLTFSVDGKVVHGKLEMFKEDGTRGFALVGLDEGIEALYRHRFPDTALIYQRMRAYEMPASVLVQTEDGTGVYVKEINGIVKYRPVEILRETEDKVYVYVGDANGYIVRGEGEEPQKTVTIFDEVFTNPAAIKDGQILD